MKPCLRYFLVMRGTSWGKRDIKLTPPHSHAKGSKFPAVLGSPAKRKFGMGKDVCSWFTGLYLECGIGCNIHISTESDDSISDVCRAYQQSQIVA